MRAVGQTARSKTERETNSGSAKDGDVADRQAGSSVLSSLRMLADVRAVLIRLVDGARKRAPPSS